MSINNSHYGADGVLLYNGEIILIYYDGVEFTVEPDTSLPLTKGHKKGRVYLTSHRVVFVNKNKNDMFQSFSMPFFCMRNLDIEQPVFGANFIKGDVKAEPNGRWEGTGKFKMWFNNGGAIEFGQCLLNAGRLASQARAAQEFAYNQVNSGNIYPAPPPSYNTLNPNSYGWVPMDRFPDRPDPNNVYMYEQPPPYSGIFQQPELNKFDESKRMPTTAANGFVDPKNPNKVYVASAPGENEAPPSYNESITKKKD